MSEKHGGEIGVWKPLWKGERLDSVTLVRSGVNWASLRSGALTLYCDVEKDYFVGAADLGRVIKVRICGGGLHEFG